MGWFSRKSDSDSYSDGLYTGDAPVSVPGADGGAPTEYRSTQRSGSSAAAPEWNADAPPAWAPTQQHYPPPSTPPGAPPWQPGAASPPPSGTSAPPWQAGAQPPPNGPGAAPPWTPWTPGQPTDQLMSAEYWQQFGRQVMSQVDGPVVIKTRRANRIVGLVIVLFIVGVVAAVAIPIVLAITSMPSFSESLEPKSVTPDAVVGSPAAASYRSAELLVTLGSVSAQPVDGWRAGASTATPMLVADVTLKRAQDDDASGSVSVMAWDWHFQPVEGPAVGGELISAYEPNLSSPDLNHGEQATGFVTFATGARAGTLWLEDPASDERIAVWEIAKAGVPAVVTGAVGKPAQGEIGLPQFAVTVQRTEWIVADDEELWNPPEKGAVLRVTTNITAAKGVESSQYLGQVYAENFWFVPAKGAAASADARLMTGTTSVVSVYGGETYEMIVAVDAQKGPGTLELRDKAGLVVIRWPVK